MPTLVDRFQAAFARRQFFQRLRYAFDEASHPRGQPENAGEFVKGAGAKAKSTAPPSKAAAKVSAAPVGEMAPARYDAAAKLWRLNDGRPLPAHLAKVRIPPAWTQVQIGLDPAAAVLAKGVDAKGRPQTQYSPAHHLRAGAVKFAKIGELARKAEAIVAQNAANMRHADPAIREAAACQSLILGMGIRPGSDRDTKADKLAYGATTLQGQHVVAGPDGVRLKFTGKKGVALDLPVRDPELARMLTERARRAGPSGKLFDTDAGRLRDYVHTLDGGSFRPKDFRTLLGTRLAAQEVAAGDPPGDEKEYKRRVREVAGRVAAVLGNTPTVALASYIDPTVFSRWRHAG